MRLILLLLVITSPLRAQFWDLASTDDGRQLYFGSSLVLRGSTPPNSSSPHRLYAIDEGGVRLISATAMTPRISGDGRVVGYTDASFCTAKPIGGSCVEAMLLGPSNADLGTGDLMLSRSGRWALVSQVSADSSAPPGTSTLVDLQTGSRTPVPPRPADSRPFVEPQSIASNGSLLVQIADASGGSHVALWQSGTLTPITVPFPLGPMYQPLALSDDGQMYLYYVRDPTARLISRKISDGTETVLFEAPLAGSIIYFMGASRDFGMVLFRHSYFGSPGPAYIADTATGRSTLLPLADGELVTDGTLSGSGAAAFLVTTRGRMVKVFVEPGLPFSTAEMIAPTPYLSSAGSRPIEVFPVAPGEVLRLWGPDVPTKPWDGLILVDGHPAAILATSGSSVDMQVPWDVSLGLRPFRLNIQPGNSAFEQNQMVYINSAVPSFLGTSGGFLGLAIVLGDFSALLTAAPAPGDIVHVYMAGLGAVSGSPPLGQPAPTDRLFPLQGTLECVFVPQATPAQTLFVGLAPKMLGIYQVDFRMPSELAPGAINGIACTLNQQPYGLWRFAYCLGQNCLAAVHYP